MFSLWAVVGLFFTLDFANTWHDLRSHLLVYLFFYFMLVTLIDSKKRFELVSLLFLSSVFFLSLYVLYIHFYLHGVGFQDKIVTGIPEIPVNWLGYLLCPALAVGLWSFKKQSTIAEKMFLVSCLCVFVVLFYMTQSRASIAAFLLIVVVFAFQRDKRAALALVFVCMFVFSMNPVVKRLTKEKIFANIRGSQFLISYEIFKDHPIVGVGYGNQIYSSKIDLQSYRKKVSDNSKKAPTKRSSFNILSDPHGLFPSLLVRTGIVGVMLFVGIVIGFFRNCFRLASNKNEFFFRKWTTCMGVSFAGVLLIAFFEPTGNHVFQMAFFTVLGLGGNLVVLAGHQNDSDTVR